MADGNTSMRCDYCHAVVAVQGDETGVQFVDEATELACPNCAVALWSAMLAGLQLHACKQCHGMLIEMGEFEALIDDLRARHPETMIPMQADAADLKQKVACPKCHKGMDTHFYLGGGHAVMSSCEQCELHWLDGGMLMQIVRAPHEEETAPSF
jgi:Zn-finger nucleic acid-binding protein